MSVLNRITCSLILASAITVGTAQANFLKSLVRVVAAPITLPAETTIKLIRRDNPLEPVKATAHAAGELVGTTTEIVGKIHETMYRVPRQEIQKTLGGDWSKAFDVLTASQRVSFEIARTSGKFLAKCLEGNKCTVHEMAAMPVAGAMRDAYNVYRGYGVPLSADVKRILYKAVAPGYLEDVLVVYGARPDFTIPGFLNSASKIEGHTHAVTLANLIIFSDAPDLSKRGDWHWLLHELKHTDQYKNYSLDPLEAIDGFAVEYVRNWQHLEDEADRVATERLKLLDQFCGSDESHC